MSKQAGVSSRRELLGGLAALAITPRLYGVEGGPVPGEPANVKVGGATSGSVGKGFCGISYEKSKLSTPFFTDRNPVGVSLFKRLGSTNLRIGGNDVDRTRWNPVGRGQTAGEVSPPDVDAMARFIGETGWTVLYGLNFATSSPETAASEASYVSKALGPSLAGLEIGNEPNGYPGHYVAAGWNVNDFIPRWQQFANAILEAAPGVALTGPGLAGGNTLNTWTIPFASAEAKYLSLLTHHYYRSDGHSPLATMDLMLSPDPAFVRLLAQLKSISGRSDLPFRFAEVNSFYNGGAPGVSDSHGSALWAIDLLFQMAGAGCAGANFHVSLDSKGYAPIADDHGLVSGPRPEYNGMLLFTLAGMGRLLSTNVTSSMSNLTAYAIEGGDQGLSVVIVNKDRFRSARISLDADRKIHNAQFTILSAPSLDARSGISLRGPELNLIDGKAGGALPVSQPPVISGNQTGCYLGPGSAVLCQLVS